MKRAVHERWKGRRFGSNPKIATLWLKTGDTKELERWQSYFQVPLLFAQFFLDSCFLFDYRIIRSAVKDKALALSAYGYGEGAKSICRVPYTFGVVFGETLEMPEPGAVGFFTPNRKWETAATVAGGKFKLTDQAEQMLLLAGDGAPVTNSLIERLTNAVK
jgi:hypothetical protein